jgi:choline dehydrogenase-like flavoprotein
MGRSSAINGQIYRGSRQDYDAPAKSGCFGWSFEEVLPFFFRWCETGKSNAIGRAEVLSGIKPERVHGLLPPDAGDAATAPVARRLLRRCDR